jgi:hypothetical protein
MKTSIRRTLLASAMLLPGTGALAPQSSLRVPQFENEEVKVWRTTVMPNAPLALHRHDHARVIIPIVGGMIKIVQESGASETHQWDAGKAYWLPADPPNQLHVDVDGGSKPIEVMVVELQKTK